MKPLTKPKLRAMPRHDIMAATAKVGGSKRRGRNVSIRYQAKLARALQARDEGPLPFRGR